MAVIVGTTWQGLGGGVSAPAVNQIVRQTHGAVLAQNEARFRSTTQATPWSWGGTWSTSSTSYATVAEGVWYATYNVAIPTAFQLTRTIAGNLVDVRITLSTLAGGSATQYTASLAAGDSINALGITYSNGSPTVSTAYRIKLEAKSPAGAAAYLYAVSLSQIDATASALY